jgi:hypothetical protein
MIYTLQVSFKIKVKILKLIEQLYKDIIEEEIKHTSQEMVDKIKITKTNYLPYQLTQHLNKNQFVNEDFGIVTIKTQKMTYNYPYLSVNFEFEFDRTYDNIDLEKIKGLIYNAFNETYSNENYSFMINDNDKVDDEVNYEVNYNLTNYYNSVNYPPEDTPDLYIYHIIEIIEVPEDIQFSLE